MILHQTRTCLAGYCAVFLQLVLAAFGEIEEVFQDELGDASSPGDYEIRLVMLDGARNTDFVEQDTTGFDREFSLRSLELRLLQ